MTETSANPEEPTLESGAYEIIRNRLSTQGKDLRSRIDRLNEARKETFGSIELAILGAERITTSNNCVPRDMVPVGGRFIFGYNVFIGLKSETQISDVFSVFEFAGESFKEAAPGIISDPQFIVDFKELYRFYKNTKFIKFSLNGPHLYMVFQVGRTLEDIKAFKWLIKEDKLFYVDNRSEHETRPPSQHEFEWKRTHRDLHRFGVHPHISIEDRIFVETVGGDLTIKIEDNTESGEGIFSEPVQDRDQTLDDAEIFYASVGHLILLRMRPYQEKDFRHIIYFEKLQTAVRMDDIAEACILLPDGQGVISPRGYYLQTGDYKKFDIGVRNLHFERRIPAQNGEDYLYVFHSYEEGSFVLLSYNIINQKIDTPIICGGFSLFENGKLIHFKEAVEAQKHHVIQVLQTPFVGQNYISPAKKESFLYRIGNRDIVRVMAETREILSLIEKEDSFANLYIDLVKKSGDVLDSYFWISKPEAFGLHEPLRKIKEISAKAVDEFEKVVRTRKATRDRIKETSEKFGKIDQFVRSNPFSDIDSFVAALTKLREIRGEIISLKDLKYVDLPTVESLEKQTDERSSSISARCADFLSGPQALDPYREKVTALETRFSELKTVVNAKAFEKNALTAAGDLQMLIEVVSGLKIEDTLKRTAIIDSISDVFSELNRVRAVIAKKLRELAEIEGQAEFHSQLKLLNQSVINAIEMCDTPETCDDRLTKIMVQIEELEGKFADFDGFVSALTEKRQEAYSAFESRKVNLIESRSKRAASLMIAADRILKGVENKLQSFKTPAEIHGYFSADPMLDKVRGILKQLLDLKDPTKADDLQTRIKVLREEALRQLKDRQDLFVDGDSAVKFGKYRFSVNRQSLDLTLIYHENEMYAHVTGTSFMEKLPDSEFGKFRDLWSREVVSESKEVYRAEFLAYAILQSLKNRSLSVADPLTLTDDDFLEMVKTFMGPRFADGYVKGVHDRDAAVILKALLELESGIGLLAYSPSARALATIFWSSIKNESLKKSLEARMDGVGVMSQVFPLAKPSAIFKKDLQGRLCRFLKSFPLFPRNLTQESAEFLFLAVSRKKPFIISREAANIYNMFCGIVQEKNGWIEFRNSTAKVGSTPTAAYALYKNWIEAFLSSRDGGVPGAPKPANRPDGDALAESDTVFLDEAAALFLTNSFDPARVSNVSTTRELTGLIGNHDLVREGKYCLNYNLFMEKLSRYFSNEIPRFEAFSSLKTAYLVKKKEELRLSQFKTKVLSSFVRNKLIDQVYIPLIGANLAKQIGVVGETKQADRMGMLLLISPPGYGKTTLMEYIANRLGITLVKVSGPTIGRGVTSLDPNEAPNAAAREELEKLNMALVMGDNVMIYVDDIQHNSSEFLEKFISLCDAQRKIEGVYQGKTKSFDLRGKKVVVVMAGNPYTESGEKFTIPDMLANRADTYNLGDIIGGHGDLFRMSYLENAATSNPVLAKLVSRNPGDLYPVMKMAETNSRDGIEFEGSYSAEDLNEYVETMKKMIRVRDVVLLVNREYILSAAQADEYRTQPPFKLQGSYRNMTRMAEKVLPIMNSEELENLIRSHFESEAQTLAKGTESNLLKFKELLNILTPEETARLDDIRKTFKKNQFLKGYGGDDRLGPLVAQLSNFSGNVAAIKDVLEQFSGKFG